MDKKLKQQIREAVITGIRRNADRIFNISQDTVSCYVPVDTGTLKKSGVIEEVPGGARIAYRTNYSVQVEFGVEHDIPITGEQIVHRNSYTRRSYRTKTGKTVKATRVKAHDVKYKDKRLIGFRPKHSKFEYGQKMFRVIDKIKARPGQFFLSRAVKIGIIELPKDIDFYMKRITGRSSVKI